MQRMPGVAGSHALGTWCTAQDTDGTGYLVYSSEDNLVMHVAALAPDYLSVLPEYRRILIGMKREAPAVFKHGDTYFLLTSGCTGSAWRSCMCGSDPSRARCAGHGRCQPIG